MTISYHQRSDASIEAPQKKRGFLRLLLILGFGSFWVLALLEGAGWLLATRSTAAARTEDTATSLSMDAGKLSKSNEVLERKIKNLAPKGQYLVIDTAGNRVYLRQGEQTVREMIASCGSGNVLEDPKGGRKWTFDTPRGEFKVLSKITDPIWIKPDWAFIEEGEPIPSKSADRAEPGMMGDYALGLGRGYFIHGTMYKRLLGRNVSHGCVRLGDEDLKHLYTSVPIGTRVIIY
jgi:L,D-transpeptidase YbiS